MDAARALLSAGADVNHQDGHGNTPVRNACQSGQIALVQLLIENDAIVTQANLDAAEAAEEINVDTVKLLLHQRRMKKVRRIFRGYFKAVGLLSLHYKAVLEKRYRPGNVGYTEAKVSYENSEHLQ